MRRTRVYVAVPLTHRRDIVRAKQICGFLTKKGMKVTSPWVAEEDAKQGLNAQEVYDRDVLAVAGSDAFVAEVSRPSLGIGMELTVALNTGTPIACLYERDNSVSWMVLGAPKVRLIDYPSENIDGGLKKTVKWLQSLPPTPIPKRLILNTNREVSQWTSCTKGS